MEEYQKKEIIELIKDHYPKLTVHIEDIEFLGDAILITGNGRQAIYRIVDDKLKFYKLEKTELKDSDTQKWKSIIRGSKIINLEK